MTWPFIFGLANLLALACWLALIAAPRGEVVKALIFYGGIGLLCLAYSLLLVLLLSGAITTGGTGGPVDFTSIAGVRSIFASDAGATVGWIHYLALDLFTGMWIARDADAKHFSRLWQAPVLVLTFLAGPFGLLVWLVLREPAARRASGRIRPRR